MAKYLVIVESPAKAKTIKKYLWKDYDVVASMGHIEDLPEKSFGVDIKKDFAPTYQILPWKKKLVSELKKLVKKYDKVYLATDEDREGEAIAWHLQRVLNLPEDTPRITFHEITKDAIQKAIKNPRTIDMNLVDSQQGRRILDRLVWYKISPILWTKIKRWLSGWRVQSVATKLIVERERQIQEFKPEEKWEIVGEIWRNSEEGPKKSWRKAKMSEDEKQIMSEDGRNESQAIGKGITDNLERKVWGNSEEGILDVKLSEIDWKKVELKSEKEVKELLSKLWFTNKIKEKTKEEKLSDYHTVKVKTLQIKQKKPFKLIKIEKKQSKKSSPAPFITSTLQQQASSSFGRSVKQVMQIAQKLYENWFITYHRTDSPTLSQQALKAISSYITQNFGKQYLDLKQYKTKSKTAQEAHEAIRPTNPTKTAQDLWLTWQAAKLYDLIRKRTLQSQMSDAIYDVQTLYFQTDEKAKDIWTAKFEKIFFPWWKILDKQSEKQSSINLKKWDTLYSNKIIAQQSYSKPPARYTESSLVKKLESLGIWRPSTYAPTISTIQQRWYVEKTQDKKLKPTDIGFLVTDYLQVNFPDLMDYGFTADMETKLDKIASWTLKYTKMLQDFWTWFKKYLEQAWKSEKIQQKVWRKCPKCGADLVYKYSKYWKFIACSNYPDCDYKEQSEEEKSYLEQLKEKYEWQPCPAGGTLVVKMWKYGPFLVSSEYPKVKWIKSIKEWELEQLNQKYWWAKCSKCWKGTMVVRKSKRWYFLACDRYPECKNVEKLKIT